MRIQDIKVELKDAIFIISALVGLGTTYGILATKVSALEKDARITRSAPSEISAMKDDITEIRRDVREIRTFLLSK